MTCYKNYKWNFGKSSSWQAKCKSNICPGWVFRNRNICTSNSYLKKKSKLLIYKKISLFAKQARSKYKPTWVTAYCKIAYKQQYLFKTQNKCFVATQLRVIHNLQLNIYINFYTLQYKIIIHLNTIVNICFQSKMLQTRNVITQWNMDNIHKMTSILYICLMTHLLTDTANCDIGQAHNSTN